MTITTEEAELHRHQIEDVRLLSLAAERDALQAEAERLKAGGCARDQGTTQFCAEAVTLKAENARLRSALNAADWVIEWTGADLLNGNPYSKVLARYQEYRRAALGETQ
jgi:hypothetical protein